MADVRCPMCGKTNPADRDTCQFCDARLKPLIIGGAPGGSAASEAASVHPGERPTPKNTDDLQADLPDWLKSMQPADESAPEPQSAGEEAAPDWLSDMRTDFGGSSTAGAEEPGSDAGEMDWLSRLGGAPEPAQEKPADSGIPDWLSGAEETPPQEELPAADWSAQPAESAVPPGGEIPDWLANFSDETTGASRVQEAAKPAEEPAGELESYDWLSQLSAEQPPAAKPAPQDQGAPDWLSSADKEMPDWFSTPAEEQSPASTEAETPDLAAGQIPDWLAQSAPGAIPSFAEETPAEQEADGFPDWLSSLDGGAQDTGQAPSWESGFAEAAQPPAAPGVSPTGPVAEGEPDWLKELESAFPEMPEAQDAAPGFSGATAAPEAGAPVSPFAFDDIGQQDLSSMADGALPSWLSEPAAVESGRAAETPEEVQPGLMPADLPSWLEAMRPVEAVGVTGAGIPEGEGQVEGAGPLAGLRGVLPAEPDIAYVRKPPAYSVKLQVSDTQQAHADLLQQLVKTEGEAQPVPSRPIIASQHILRIMIGVVLILFVLIPIIAGIPAVDVPTMAPDAFAGEFQASQAIERVNQGSPVLIVVDYEPGLSGEMEAAAGVVVDHLLLKGAYLALVSTSPTGPAQAERLISQANQLAGHNHTSPETYQNLGYIPGGTSGVLSFMEDLPGTLPQAWDGSQISQNPALQGVISLQNFALVVVATENPETARTWIEQAQFRLGIAPLVMVVSAQIEPVVRPYFDARPQQVHGLVSGIAGGAVYEKSLARPGTAGARWAAFSVGMLAASFLIILGGILAFGSAVLAKSKETTGGEA